MRWLTRHFTVPILLGLSLTSFSIAMLYVLYKKDKEDIESNRRNIEITRRTTTECKVPRQFVPAIIGRGGSVIKDVQSKTGTQIHFKEDDIKYSDRICIIKGSFQGVRLAEEMIKSIIENQPIIETYEMFVPQKACGRIIGRGGEVILQIQMASSAKIIVDDSFSYHPNGERRIIIKGTTEQIATALSQIEDKVREDKEACSKLKASSATRQPRGVLSPRNTAIAMSEHSIERISLPVTDGLMELYISAMENPNQFWVQVVGSGTAALDKLVIEMNDYYNIEENRELHTLRNVTIGQIVAAKFSFDEQWYRAKVISAPENDQCEVYYVDYGDHEILQLGSLLELRTDFLSLRLQAFECSLANVKPRENEWSSEACDRFAELTSVAQWKVVIAKVKGYKKRVLGCGRSRCEGSPIPCVDLFKKDNEKDINIGQELIREGLAEPEEALSSATSSTLSLLTRSHEITNISTPTSASPLARGVSSSETPLNTTRKLDSTIDTSNIRITDFDTTKNTPTRTKIEEIDLVTPHKTVGQVEIVDLVTPVKDETSRFIDNEKGLSRKDDNNDYLRNGSKESYGNSRKSQIKVDKFSRIAPAGYESDLSADSDELELG